MDADKRVVLGSEKPSEGVATSLRFPSQPGSFSPGSYGSEAGPPDGQPDSPIKTSPVSERIKALEALAAKKKEPDFRSDGGFPHFRDRHFEKSPAETVAPSVQKKGGSVEQESPESPFEVLGDLRQVNEFEETAEWMKAHLPPVPDFDDALNLIKHNAASKEIKEADPVIPDAPAAFAGVPDAFMDSPSKALKLKDDEEQPSVEEESEFDLSFLPTAYMWDQQEKSGPQAPSKLDSVLPASPAPPAGFGSPSPPVSPPVGTNAKQNVSDPNKTMWAGDLEPPEASEVDSSGESDDTVIEDGVPVAPPSSGPAPSKDLNTSPASSTPTLPTEEKETPPPRAERKLMQVPTINVIETDDPNYSEEEMEMEIEAEEDDGYEVVKDPDSENNKTEPSKTRPIETDFMEGYSPPSSPVDSDAEGSPQHNTVQSNTVTVHQEFGFKMDPNTTASQDVSQAQSEKSPTSGKINDNPSPFSATNEEVDFPDNDDEWSDEAEEVLFKPSKPDLTPHTKSKMDEKSSAVEKETCAETVSFPKSSFMQDDIYDRQSFDDDYDSTLAFGDFHDEKKLNNASATQNDVPGDTKKLKDNSFSTPDGQLFSRQYPLDPYSSFQSQPLSNMKESGFDKKMNSDIVTHGSKAVPVQESVSKTQRDTNAGTENMEPDSSESGPTDSFVDFMRECLKSRQDEEPDSARQPVASKDKSSKAPPSNSPPTMVMDLEQERLTISALKELGSSQDDEVEVAQLQPSMNISGQAKADHNAATNLTLESKYSKEVEAIDEWMAEAYHLAEHVLTAILTHFSGNASSSWAVGPLTSCSQPNFS